MRKTTSLKIEPGLWKKVKKYCIDQEIDISDYIEELIRKNMSGDGSNKKVVK